MLQIGQWAELATILPRRVTSGCVFRLGRALLDTRVRVAPVVTRATCCRCCIGRRVRHISHQGLNRLARCPRHPHIDEPNSEYQRLTSWKRKISIRQNDNSLQGQKTVTVCITYEDYGVTKLYYASLKKTVFGGPRDEGNAPRTIRPAILY